MSIFKRDDDASIDDQFSSIIQAIEVSLFREFKKGYKNGLKYGQFESRTSLLDKAKEIGADLLALEKPYDLGFLTGLTVWGITSGSTYDSDAVANILCEFISFLRTVPGFNMDVLRKRVKRIDVKGFSPENHKSLKLVLRELSKK